MDEERAFLRRIHTHPEDRAARLVYADWLDDRGDPRAAYARTEPVLARPTLAAWLETQGLLFAYPEGLREHQASAAARQHRLALAAQLDPAWVAFMDFSCPFDPFYFFNNHGLAREMPPEELPFVEPIGTRGAVVTWASDFQTEASYSEGLMRNLAFLRSLELDECAYGAATCPVHPFLCEIEPAEGPLTAAQVLAALRPRQFHNPRLPTLETSEPAYLGYIPERLDEIHRDFTGQHLFQCRDEEEAPVSPSEGAHGALLDYVRDGKLWYVLLHTTPKEMEGFLWSRYVILFGVGLSPEGERLVGVVSHQRCHNLCD